MINMSVAGTLGKYGYHNIPEDIAGQLVKIAIDTAYMTAIKKAPFDPTPDGIHIKDEIKKEYDEVKHNGAVFVKLPYVLIAEFGSKKRLPHPYMRPAGKAAQNKMKATIRKAVKEAIAAEKLKAGT